MDQKLRKTSITPSEADKPEKPAFSATATDQEIAQLTNKMKLATQSILETFISEQAKKEVNITARQRKAILAELESGNLHPEVWRPAFEHIANLLRSNSLTKFLRATE
jgi:hypothetical protein